MRTDYSLIDLCKLHAATMHQDNIVCNRTDPGFKQYVMAMAFSNDVIIASIVSHHLNLSIHSNKVYFCHMQNIPKIVFFKLHWSITKLKFIM